MFTVVICVIPYNGQEQGHQGGLGMGGCGYICCLLWLYL